MRSTSISPGNAAKSTPAMEMQFNHKSSKMQHSSSSAQKRPMIMKTGGASDYTQEKKILDKSNLLEEEEKSLINKARIRSSKLKW